jgi:hypothetical protein
MKSGIALGALGLGVFLLILGTLWSSLFRAEAAWTDEKAVRSADVKARLPYLKAIIIGQKKASAAEVEKAKAEFDALTKENEELNAEFTSVAETPQSVAKIFKWTGIALAIVGLIGWYAVNQSR